MHPNKQIYAGQMVGLVVQVCQSFFEGPGDAVWGVLHLEQKDMEDIISKIVIALPDSHFYRAQKPMLQDMLEFIVKHYILFQVQEDASNDWYAYSLINFIQSIDRMIRHRYYSSNS